MQTQFEGIWVPIITPFAGNAVDHPALARLARHLASQGIAGLVAGATTGEGALLHPGEQEAIFATLREAVPGVPLVLGVSQSATDAAVDQARRLASLAPEGLLVTAPPYVRPSQEGLRRHFEAIVEAADRPILIYNIPYRSGVSVEIETLQALAGDPRIVGIKECGASNERLLRLVQETPLRVLSGDDNQNFIALCLGAHGTIAAAAHLHAHRHVCLYEALRANDVVTARRIAMDLRPLIADLFAEPNPAPLKALLADQGWCANVLRLPFLPASDALHARLREDLARLDALPL